MRRPVPLVILNTLYTLRAAYGLFASGLFLVAVLVSSSVKWDSRQEPWIVTTHGVIFMIMLIATIGLWRMRLRSVPWFVGASIADGFLFTLRVAHVGVLSAMVMVGLFAVLWNIGVVSYLLGRPMQMHLRGETPKVERRSEGRPRAFALIAWLLLISGVLEASSLVYAVRPQMWHQTMVKLHQQGSVSDQQLAQVEAQLRSAWFVPSVVLGGISSVLFITASVGLLKRKSWGRTMMLGLAAISAILTLVNLVLLPTLRDPHMVSFLILGWLWQLFVLWYLYRPQVSAFLGRPASSGSTMLG